MTIHVFIGVGPANLHRALKIQKIDPTAKLVFIDQRLRPEARDIDRVTARANIFRFEAEDVTARLIEDGVKEEDLFPLIHQREFSVERGFQSGDDKVFASKPFTEIQIRDLQLLLMKTIDEKGEENNRPLLLKKKIGESTKPLPEEIAELLKEQQDVLRINPSETQDIKIHVATGVLTGDEKKAEIIYPDTVNLVIPETTDDVAAATVLPLHGTTTFIINDTNAATVTLDELEADQRSLDLTEWQPALQQYGWNLIRPPRIRVFYANDILYIGTEIPSHMKEMPKEQFEQQLTDYTRTIASLVFPGLPINKLPVNPHLRFRFTTARGERGSVISSTFDQELPWGNEKIRANVTVLAHGDSRYLPHYQTGSGFVTAFLQNELYAEIYSRHSFPELIEWLKTKPGVIEDKYLSKLQEQYEEMAENDKKAALEAFQQELFMAFSRDIIDENKKKVGRYFNAIHTQALTALGSNIEELLATFNSHQGSNLKKEMFEGLFPSQVAIELLKIDNVGFLRKVLPQLLNQDFINLTDKEILHIRNVHILDFKRNLNLEGYDIPLIEEVIQEVIGVKNIRFELNADKIIGIYNSQFGTNFKANELNPMAKKVLVMEMLNTKIKEGQEVPFVREALFLLTSEDLSEFSNKSLLEKRDAYTKDYPVLFLADDYSEMIRQHGATDEMVKKLASVDGKNFNTIAADFSFPIISKESDAEALRSNLLFEAVKQNDSSHPFYKNMNNLINEPNVQKFSSKLQAVATMLDSNKELHHRAFISFFTGKHSETIHKFAKDIQVIADGLNNPDLTLEQRKNLVTQALNTMMTFHDNLEKGSSRRTMQALLKASEEVFAPVAEVNLGV